jgi:HAD superfamily hydrolase (TIGR01509 family)
VWGATSWWSSCWVIKAPKLWPARPRRYQELIAEARPFPGAADLLTACHTVGLVVVIASSAADDELGALLERLDVAGAIDATTSADDVGASKPDPEVFLEAMETGAVDPNRALAVADSIWDVRAERAAHIGCVAVETGGYSAHELREEGASQVYRDVGELLDQFATSPLARLLR